MVRIVEVGLRDGLQNEKAIVSLAVRHQLLRYLLDAGLRYLEVGSFVSPSWVPAMASSEELFALAMQDLKDQAAVEEPVFSALVPNEKGMEPVLRLGIKEIAIFSACSETFSKKNTNCTIDESFQRLAVVAKLARQKSLRIRGYLSTCFGCPFEGAIDRQTVSENIQRMLDLGVYEVSLGDTIGLAGAGDVEKLLDLLLKKYSPVVLAGHFHDTRGQAVANILRAYQMGLRTFDTSIGGLGGCPYAPGATGNVATEDVVYLFNSLGVATGVDMEKLLLANSWLSQAMKKSLPSKVGLAAQFSQNKSGTCFL